MNASAAAHKMTFQHCYDDQISVITGCFPTRFVVLSMRFMRSEKYFVAGTGGDSLRCFGGRNGGKFQECQYDAGYRTCFTKFENGI